MRGRDLTHEHEWMDEAPDVFWDGDVFVSWTCGWVEITGSQHSERHDETFYETGAECCATKTAVYELYIAEGDERVEDDRMYEHLWDNHVDTIEKEAEILSPRDLMAGFSIKGSDVGLGDDYVVVFELDKATVDEDWC